ncbi:MAG: T9SS type A sorting domain-containing protein [Saprospiraceae bacterium]|nr:T9SS type A sorting domain-containing protein [Saprospiraceae bacterium]
MRKNLFLLCLAAAFISAVYVPNNPELELTAAPGELTCMKCHSGGSFNGMVLLEGIPDTVVAGQTYDVKLIHRSNARRAGFQLTSLDPQHERIGNLIQGTGTNVAVGRTFGRQYIRQTSARVLNNGETSWDFKWRAPDSMSGDSIYFYFVSLAANSDGNNTGDNVLLGKRPYFYFNPTSGTQNISSEFKPIVFPNPVSHTLHISGLPETHGLAEIFNSDGQLVKSFKIKGALEVSLEGLIPGIYHLRFSHPHFVWQDKFMKI